MLGITVLIIMQVTKYIYSSIVFKYKFEVNVFKVVLLQTSTLQKFSGNCTLYSDCIFLTAVFTSYFAQ